MDEVAAALAEDEQEIQAIQQDKYVPASGALRRFFEQAAGRVTERGSERTNIIDRGFTGGGATYDLADDDLARLLLRAEDCRRAGVTLHLLEKQGNAASPHSGIMLDYDVALRERPAETQMSMGCGAAPRRVPAVLSARARRDLCAVIARQLVRDLVFRRAAGEEGAAETQIAFFFIVRPEVTPCCAPGSTDAAYYKYGFHVLIPGVQTTRGYKKFLIDALRSNDKHSKILASVGAVGAPGSVGRPPAPGASPLAECLDSGSASVPAHFFGSCKRGGKLYALGGAHVVEVDDDDGSRTFSTSTLQEEALARRNLCYELSLWARPPAEVMRRVAAADDGGAGAAGALGYDPPLVTPRRVHFREELRARIETMAERTAGGALPESELRDTDLAVAEVCARFPPASELKLMLGLLGNEYSADYAKWRNVAFVLCGASVKDTGCAETYYPLAALFSQNCAGKWNAGGREALRALWDGAAAQAGARGAGDRRPLTRRSLAYWARTASPDTYAAASGRSHRNILRKYVFGYGGVIAHAMVAEVLHAVLGDRFVVDCVDPSARTPHYQWYEFVAAGRPMRRGEVWKWRAEGDPDEMHLFVSNTLAPMLGDIRKEIDEKLKDAEQEQQAKYYKELLKKVTASQTKLFDNGFKRSTVEQARYLFRRRGFADELDSHPHLLGVANGVLRVAGAERPASELIATFHEWPVSRFTSVEYRPFDPDEEWSALLLDAVRKIVPELDMRVWLMMYLATGVYHGLKPPMMLFLTGSGSNAKSFLVRMTQKALGGYALKLNVGLLVSEREQSDRANSALMQLKGHSFGYFDESNRAEKINIARLKEFVNAGDINGRDLRDKQENFQSTATLTSASNYPFIIDTKDHGTWRRIGNYVAKAKFCANPDPNNPYEHLEDKRYLQEFVDEPECQAAWLGILVHFWEQLQADYGGDFTAVPCPTLARETEEYRNSQDVLNRFITQSVVVSPHHDRKYPLAAIASIYCDWYHMNVESSRRYVATEVISYLENSALSKYLVPAPNGTRVLAGCRVLQGAEVTQALADGEQYIGSRRDDRARVLGRPGYCPDSGMPEPRRWWEWRWGRGADRGAPLATAADVAAADAAAEELRRLERPDAPSVAEELAVAEGVLRRRGEHARARDDAARREDELGGALDDALDDAAAAPGALSAAQKRLVAAALDGVTF